MPATETRGGLGPFLQESVGDGVSSFTPAPSSHGTSLRGEAAETIAAPDGPIYFPPDQAALFSVLFDLCASQQGFVSGAQAYLVLRHTLLADSTLRKVWKLASTSPLSKPRLDRAEFFCLLRLIAITQERNGFAPESRAVLWEPSYPMLRLDLFASSQVAPLLETTRSVSIEVVPPSLIGPTFYKVSALILSDRFGQQTFESLRRYREFFFLRELLVAHCPTTIVPVLPPKAMLFNSSSEFLAERRDGLQIFIQELLAHPRLKDRFEVEAFLCGLTPAGWNALERLAAANRPHLAVRVLRQPIQTKRVTNAKRLESVLLVSLHSKSHRDLEPFLTLADKAQPILVRSSSEAEPACFSGDRLLRAWIKYDAARLTEQSRYSAADIDLDDLVRSKQALGKLGEIAFTFMKEAASQRQSWVEVKEALMKNDAWI